MEDTKPFIEKLLAEKNIAISEHQIQLFEEFINEADNRSRVQLIQENLEKLMKNWEIRSRIHDIKAQHVHLPNGTVEKSYETQFDFLKLGWDDIIYYEVEGFEQAGLNYDYATDTIKGVPEDKGDFKILFRFRVDGEEENSELNEKFISLVINPNPRSLWKNLPSDMADPFWKEDEETAIGQLGEKNIVVASKRGRSHANVGSFRDDDFAFKYLEDSGWSVIAVADGAGSAKYSRKGSQLACNHVVEHFEENFNEETLSVFDQLLEEHQTELEDDSQKKLNHFLYRHLGKAALSVHQKLAQLAKLEEATLNDFNTTLIFTLFKKYDFGYTIISFGVGDCPIGFINKDKTEITLMNHLDVGEFGGGTRFITMPEIFKNEQLYTRFGFQIVEDFSYLMLMTDGIYDPKFEVEANLEKIEKWNMFLKDLGGDNEAGAKVLFNKDNDDIADQLSNWMDFWAPGNHDDRTLAVIF